MTKKLSDWEKQGRKQRRQALTQVKRLANNKNIKVEYNYENDFRWLPDGRHTPPINHRITLTWSTYKRLTSSRQSHD